MRLGAQLVGDLRKMLAEEVRAGERAAMAAIRGEFRRHAKRRGVYGLQQGAGFHHARRSSACASDRRAAQFFEWDGDGAHDPR
jgi:hypothetical protein